MHAPAIWTQSKSLILPPRFRRENQRFSFIGPGDSPQHRVFNVFPGNSGGINFGRTDNFDRANNALSLGIPSDGGSAWVPNAGTWGIIGNKGYCPSATSQASAYLEALITNAFVQTVISGSDLGDCGLVGRCADDNNYILLTWFGGNANIFTRILGAFTPIAINAMALVAGDVLKLEITSTNVITGYQNGVAKITATNAFGAGNTKWGIRTHLNGQPRFDNLSIGSA